MTLQELQTQALQLSVDDRLQLISALQRSLPMLENEIGDRSEKNTGTLQTAPVDPWIESLIGVIQQPESDIDQDYVDYLEEKYR